MMYYLRKQNFVGLLYLEALPLAVSLLVAEWFFKFGTFLLEAVAFIALWYGLSVIYTAFLSFLSKVTGLVPPPERFLPAYQANPPTS